MAVLRQNRPALDRARELKKRHLRAMVGGEYGLHYVEERLKLGLLYAQVGLDVRLFLRAFHHLMRLIGFRVMEEHADHKLGFERFMSLKKIGFFDLSLIVDVIVFEREHIIRAQGHLIKTIEAANLMGQESLPLVSHLMWRRRSSRWESMWGN